MQKHFRLIEAIGLVLVLIAGYLEVTSIRAHDRLRLESVIAMDTEMMAFNILKRLISMEELQAFIAVYPDTRNGLPKTIQLNPLERSRWHNILAHALFNFALQYHILEVRARHIQDFRTGSGLPLSTELDDIAKAVKLERERMESEIRAVEQVDGANEKLQRDIDMAAIQRSFDNYSVSITKIAQHSFRESNDRRGRQSKIYLTLFVIGSMLLVIGKLGNWFQDNRPRAA